MRVDYKNRTFTQKFFYYHSPKNTAFFGRIHFALTEIILSGFFLYPPAYRENTPAKLLPPPKTPGHVTETPGLPSS